MGRDEAGRAAELRILGPLQLVMGGVPRSIGGPQARVVLAQLIAGAGQVVSVDQLDEALWGDDPPPAAGVTVRAYLSRLRSVLAPAAPDIVVRTVAPGYVLDVEADVLDSARFERGVQVGRRLLETGDQDAAAKALEDALDEWRGEVLPELADRAFLQPSIARLDGLRLTAVEDRFEALLGLGAHDAVLPELERHAEDHPTRERAWELRMRALYQAGRQADALAAYGRIRELLAEELGIEPGPGLESMQLQILRHELDVPPSRRAADAALAAPARAATVPRHDDEFFGRERELATVEAALAPGRIVTLVGVAGVGKTRLAIESARRVIEGNRDGADAGVSDAIFVDLSLVPANVSATALATTIAAAAHVRIQSRDHVIDELAAALGPTNLLLVLDNCEHLVDAVATIVAALVSSAGRNGVRVLATSRAPVRLAAEVVIPVNPLPVTDEAGGDDGSAAVSLLADRVRRATGRDEEDRQTMAALCRRLDGLPLAIELVAARARTFSLVEIDRRLGDRLAFLEAWSRLANPRHATLRAALDWSFELLAPGPRTVFIALGVFRSSFALDDAIAVAGADGPGPDDPSRVEEAIARLVDASLVVRSSDGATSSFSMLETVRAYAWERLIASADGDAVRTAHARRVADVVERLARSRDTPAEAAAFDRLERLLPDVRAALDWSRHDESAPDGPRIVRWVADTWRIRGYVDEAIRELELALAAVEATRDGSVAATSMRPALLGQLGVLLARATDLVRAEALLDEAAAGAAATGDDRLRGWCLHALAFVQRTRGATGDAKRTLALAISLRRASGDLGGLAWSIGNLADIAQMEGDYDLAERLYDEGGLVVAAVGDPPGLSLAYLESRARLALRRGDPAAALALAERARDAARRFGDRWHVGLTTAVIAASHRRLADPAAAARDALDAFDVFTRLGEQGGRAEAAEVLAGALVDRGVVREASLLLASAAAARARAGVPVEPARTRLVEEDRARARSLLGDAADDAARVTGSTMSLDAAIAAVRAMA